MINTVKYLVIVFMLMCVSNLAYAVSDVIRLAITTSTKSSGLLNILIPAFEKQTSYKVKTIIAGTGKALRLGREGAVDVLIVHAPRAEKAFVDAGFGIERHKIMHNDFVIVGPKSDPSRIKSLKNITSVLKQLMVSGYQFISRADDSGTHKKELMLWKKIKLEPFGAWYFEAGMSMAKTLKLADDEQAYTLTDRGTWLAKRDLLSLVLLFEGDAELNNPYSIIAVSPERNSGLNLTGSMAFINWVLSKPGQSLIANYRLHGERLFVPVLENN